jgi:hypothetical protein
VGARFLKFEILVQVEAYSDLRVEYVLEAAKARQIFYKAPDLVKS